MILCFGATPTMQRSMIFNHLQINEVNRAAEVKDYASGKSPNVARVLRSLGADPLEVGFAGGIRGKQLLDDLSGAGIRCDFVNVHGETRLCTTVIDRATNQATELVEEHAVVPTSAWEEMDCKLRALLPTSKHWIFSGSFPAGAPQDFYARWIPLAKEVGATLVLDTRGEPLKKSLAHPGFIAKLNRDELAGTLGRQLTTDADLLAATRQIVPPDGAAIITAGPRGVIASDGKHTWRLTPPTIIPVSAVGSGDAFAAGLTLALSRGASLPEALPLAAAAGAANALTALAGHLNAEDVERLMPQVTVTLEH